LYDINAAALQPSTFANLLLLPALTDIRSGLLVVQPDFVQIPAGSGRWYQVVAVDDIGKGFPNEHRAAQCMQVSVLTDAGLSGLLWPVPMP
jgi:hypothetical protein